MDDTVKIKKRVAIYMRCVSKVPGKEFAYEYQKRYYENMIGQKADWELKDFYIDEGLSGTLQHRPDFDRMIEDCKEGEIDLIVTRNVSRFSRNLKDCIDCIRKLKAMDPSVGVLFEAENFYSLDDKTDMLLTTILPDLINDEIHTKSGIMGDSFETRYKRGIFLSENGGA